MCQRTQECVSRKSAWPRIVPGPSRPSAVRPLDRGLAVAADHLAHLDDALRDVHRERQPALARRGVAVAQQIGGAGVDLHRRDDAREPAARMRQRRVDDLERGREPGPAARLVPGVKQLVVVLHGTSAPRRSPARESRAARSWRTARPSRSTAREISTRRGDAGAQQLAIGGLGAGRARLVVGRRQRLRALVEPGHVHARQPVLLADAAIERLVLGVRMDVDEAGHHRPVAAVDDPVRRRRRNRGRYGRCGRR